MNTDDTGFKDVYALSGPSNSKLLTWSNDGRSLFFTEYNSAQIMRVVAVGSDRAEFTGLTINGDSWYTMGFTEGGSRIVFSAHTAVARR